MTETTKLFIGCVTALLVCLMFFGSVTAYNYLEAKRSGDRAAAGGSYSEGACEIP